MKLIQDLRVSQDRDHGIVRRRPQWRGERKAVLTRMAAEVAALLARQARLQRRSVSEHAGLLLVELLVDGGDAAA